MSLFKPHAINGTSQHVDAYRNDIQGLRGIAILLVILFHANLWSVSGGFVGVDVFFVISGYVITEILVRDMRCGTFSLTGFYERRMRRLIPALVLMLAAVTAIGGLLLAPAEYQRLGESLIWSAISAGNLHDWALPDGYFSLEPSDDLLLHTWSLGVEAQFYLVYPLVVLGLRRCPPKLRIGLAAASFALPCGASILVMLQSPWSSAPFYLPQYRIWEFLLGASAFTLQPRLGGLRLKPPLQALILLAGLAMILIPANQLTRWTPYPGLPALAPTFGAAILLTWGATFSGPVNRVLTWRPLVWLGDLSYGLYLWHWPINLVLTMVVPGHDPRLFVAANLVLPMIPAVFSAVVLERPFRSRRLWPNAARMWRGCAAACLLMVLCGGDLVALQGVPMRIAEPLRSVILENEAGINAPWPLDGICPNNFRRDFDHGAQITVCHLGPAAPSPGQRSVLFVGDSQLEQLVPAMEKALVQNPKTKTSFNLVTHGSCLPVTGIEMMAEGARDDRLHCAAFARQAFALAQGADVQTVVLGGLWVYLAGENRLCRTDPQTSACQKFLSQAQATEFVEKSLIHDIDVLRLFGKKVFLVLPFPLFEPKYFVDFNRRLMMGAPLRRELPMARHQQDMMVPIAMLRRVAQATGSVVIDPTDILCPNSGCLPHHAGHLLYRDHAHLNRFGGLLFTDLMASFLTSASQTRP